MINVKHIILRLETQHKYLFLAKKIYGIFPNVFYQKIEIYYSTGTKQFNVYWTAGGRLNKKDGLTRYGNSHVKDKTS